MNELEKQEYDRLKASHDELVAALKGLVNALSETRASWCNTQSTCVPIHSAFDDACDALARARGEAS